MNIYSFEKEVSGTIVARGFAYFKNGNIIDVEYQEHNTYTFLIRGSDSSLGNEDQDGCCIIRESKCVSRCTCNPLPFQRGSWPSASTGNNK